MLRKSYRHFQYFLDRAFAHGVIVRLGLLLVISLLIVLIGTLAPFLGLFGPENDHVATIDREYGEGALDAFWWSLKHAVDPGTFTADYGSSIEITLFALFITICGMAVFGTFIGLISAGITERLQVLDRGIGDVIERDHALILGWNSRAPAVISKLVSENKSTRVVVLAEKEIAIMVEQLRLTKNMTSKRLRKIVFRQGLPTIEQNLERVSYRQAGRIIILADDNSSAEAASFDICAIELINFLAHNQNWETKPPHIVAEIQDPNSHEIANLAGDYQIPVVTSADLTSRILVQCSRQPDLSAVYFELFSASKNKLLLKKIPECIGLTFGEILNSFPNATPIGICDVLEHDGREIHIPDLNPPSDHIIEEQEKVILITKSPVVSFVKEDKNLPPLSLIDGNNFQLEKLETILILGWNKSIYSMLSQYDDYLTSGRGHVKIVSSLDTETAGKLLQENLPKALSNITYELQQSNFLKQDVMKSLLGEEIDKVIILSHESSTDRDPDSHIKMALILIHAIYSTNKIKHLPHVVAEIIENTGTFNRMPFSQFEIVTSPEIVSLMLTHLAIENDLRTVTTELLTPSGQEVYLKPAICYLNTDTEFSYPELVKAAKLRGDLLIGFVYGTTTYPDKTLAERVDINPEKTIQRTLNSDDKVIVLSSGLN